MAQKIAQYVNPVLAAIKKLGGSARPAEVCAAVVKEMSLEGAPILEQTLGSGVSKFEKIWSPGSASILYRPAILTGRDAGYGH